MPSDIIRRLMVKDKLVPASIGDVWQAWTTVAGATSFFAPMARLELRLGGPYEGTWDIVLGRLVYRFSVGPIDWDQPYMPAAQAAGMLALEKAIRTSPACRGGP